MTSVDPLPMPTWVEIVSDIVHVLYIVPQTIQPLLIMYIYQESWRSVLQSTTYPRFARIQTLVIWAISAVIVADAGYILYIQLSTETDTADAILIYPSYIVFGCMCLTIVLQCISLTVLWAKSLSPLGQVTKAKLLHNQEDVSRYILPFVQYYSAASLLSPITLLLLCNLSTVWDKRPQWMRRDPSGTGQRDAGRDGEVYL
ncbi:hypothetical protein KIPB_007662 [Kipferlia bialata]|uniref:Uncharacterized protein n=1 Tax=Kipferlia bialata TaxID=797122 RepID=A0A9K3D0K6_9EUKA|nr:hypothetical protein KIPB_007662 [Kipferlia bialata]|eukprot:g7662.t1